MVFIENCVIYVLQLEMCDHRITEYSGLERTHNDHQSPALGPAAARIHVSCNVVHFHDVILHCIL